MGGKAYVSIPASSMRRKYRNKKRDTRSPVVDPSPFAVFAFVHAVVALLMLVLLEKQNAEHFCQCLEACFLLSMVVVCSIMFHHMAHVTMTVCSVVQMLAAALARAATFVAFCIAVATGMQSIRLVYTTLFGTQCSASAAASPRPPLPSPSSSGRPPFRSGAAWFPSGFSAPPC